MGRSGRTRLPVISFTKFLLFRFFSPSEYSPLLRLWEIIITIILHGSNNRSSDFAVPRLSKNEICCPRFIEMTDFQTQEQKMNKITEAQRRKTRSVRGADTKRQHVHLSHLQESSNAPIFIAIVAQLIPF